MYSGVPGCGVSDSAVDISGNVWLAKLVSTRIGDFCKIDVSASNPNRARLASSEPQERVLRALSPLLHEPHPFWNNTCKQRESLLVACPSGR